jgi:hypothetical protein
MPPMPHQGIGGMASALALASASSIWCHEDGEAGDQINDVASHPPPSRVLYF